MRIDQAEAQRRLGVEGLAEQQKLSGRFRRAETQRREERRARLRHEAEIDEGHREPRARTRVDEIAMKAQRRADADRLAVNGGDQWLVERRQRMR